MDCSPLGSSVHEILQTRILVWIAIPSSGGSSWPGIKQCLLRLLHSLMLGSPGNLRMVSVQFSPSVVSDSLEPLELQHTRPHLSPVHHQLPESSQILVHRVSDAIQPSHPLSSPSLPASQSLLASESFPMSQHFSWGGQSTGVSALASVLPMNTQDWCPLEWTGWISLQSKGLSRVFSNTTVQKHQFFGAQLSSQSNSHIHTWPLEKP